MWSRRMASGLLMGECIPVTLFSISIMHLFKIEAVESINLLCADDRPLVLLWPMSITRPTSPAKPGSDSP